MGAFVKGFKKFYDWSGYWADSTVGRVVFGDGFGGRIGAKKANTAEFFENSALR